MPEAGFFWYGFFFRFFTESVAGKFTVSAFYRIFHIKCDFLAYRPDYRVNRASKSHPYLTQMDHFIQAGKLLQMLRLQGAQSDLLG